LTDTLTWTVPDEGGIWEIHLKVSNGNGVAHREWVVSTLNTNEAPEFFEYFTDAKYAAPRSDLDPWDRALPEWSGGNTQQAETAKALLDGGNSGVALGAAMTIPCGTWKFKYCFPHANIVPTGVWVTYTWAQQFPHNSQYGKRADTHHHCGIHMRDVSNFSFDYDGCGWPEDGKWHQVTIVRTPDNWVYMYNDYTFEFYVDDGNLTPAPEKIILNPATTVYLDAVEVYRDQYLFPRTFPSADVVCRDYTWNYRFDGTYYVPLTRTGIVAQGRNLRLADIAQQVNDPEKFTYYDVSRTAVCNSDLVIYDGSVLIMQNETLRFGCNTDGQYHFVVRYGAELQIADSTLGTTGVPYFIWNNAGSTTHLGRPMSQEYRQDPLEFQRVYYRPYPLGNAGAIRFSFKNSTVQNAAHIFWDSPMELDIENSRFLDLHAVDIGDYSKTENNWNVAERTFAQGDKSFWIYLDEVNTNLFKLENLVFGSSETPLNLTFMVNSLRDKLNLYNLDAPGDNAVIRKSIPQSYGQSHTWIPYLNAGVNGYYCGMDSKLGLVNCRFKSIQVPTDKAWAVPKYYLDVKVVYADGTPASGAVVTVANDVDNLNYPAENKESIKQLFSPPVSSSDQYFYLSNQLIQGRACSGAVTAGDGHTPMPADAAHTLILTDFVQDKNSSTNFTYTITAEKDGLKGRVRGVDPDANWYRADPQIPVITIVATLGREMDLSVASDKSNIVFPNPYVQGKHQGNKITFSNLPPHAKIDIFTAAGAKVAKLEYPDDLTGGLVTWDISRVAGGIYVYTISSRGSIAAKGKVSVVK